MGEYTAEGPTDRALRALSHRNRRQLLFELFDAERAAEGRPRLDPFRGAGRDAEQTALYHVHLPMLAAHGFICWDTRDGTVTVGPNWGAVEPLLALVYRHLNERPASPGGTGAAP